MNRFVCVRHPLCAVASLLCFAAALLLMPAEARSPLAPRTPDAARPLPAHTEQAPVAVAPDVDAFAPRASVDDDPHPPARILPSPPAAPRLPYAATLPPRANLPMRVAAVATGAQPTAIVEIGGMLRVVTAGDALDGSSVAAIDDEGVRLDDGRRIALEPKDGER